jgi:hypothetical protein
VQFPAESFAFKEFMVGYAVIVAAV